MLYNVPIFIGIPATILEDIPLIYYYYLLYAAFYKYTIGAQLDNCNVTFSGFFLLTLFLSNTDIYPSYVIISVNKLNNFGLTSSKNLYNSDIYF